MYRIIDRRSRKSARRQECPQGHEGRQGEEQRRTDDIADTHVSKVIQVPILLLLRESQYHPRYPI
jgi:hypothetical protein